MLHFLRVLRDVFVAPEDAFAYFRHPRHAIATVLCCSVLQGGVPFIVIRSGPTFIESPLRRELSRSIKDLHELDSRVQAALSHRAAGTGIGLAARSFVATLLLTAVWMMIGLLIRVPSNNVVDVFGAMAMAAITSTVGVVAAYSISVLGQVEPPMFMLGGRVADNASLFERIMHVHIVRLWWSVVAAAGLAKAWRAPFTVTLTLTMVMTLVVLNLLVLIPIGRG
jgi:hypothetical protein